jgi:phage terminase large subunit
MKVDFSRFYELLNKSFWDFFENKCRVRISYGGSGSGKSVAAFLEILYKIIAEPGHNYLVCRKVAATNKTSTYSLLIQLINQLGLSSLFQINKTDMSFTVKSTSHMIVLKGLDDIEKIKSFTFPNGILTDIVIEEASEITKKDFDQLNVRLRGARIGEQKGIPFQITMLLNPIINTHWIKQEFIDKKSYQKGTIVDGKAIKGMSVYILKTTYLDNEFIDDDYKAVLESYKEIDYEFYRVYCLGEWGVYGNIIFTNWTFGECPYKEEDFDAIYVGQDFGYVHPQVIVKIGFKDGVMYTYNELCAFEKTNAEVIAMNKEMDVLHPGEAVICDSAEPSMIKEWRQADYGALPAVKGKDSVTRGIDFINSQKWIIDDSKCPRTAQEVQQYHRKEDKDGNYLEEPVKLFNDAMDSHRYALEPLSRMKGNPSVLSGKKSDQKKSLIEAKREERKQKREVVKAQRKAKREKKRKNEKK